jgi:CubicO group peptidase (beta-lactamase class C family)
VHDGGRDFRSASRIVNNALDHAIEESAFSGVVRVIDSGAVAYERACGPGIRLSTQLAIASGSKSFTAITIAALIGDGVLSFDTTARSLLGDDLPLIASDVTIEHLLAHTSGIGDYLDEEAETEGDREVWPLAVPASALTGTRDYLAVLDGYPTKFAAGTRFAYCNSGYVVLAMLAELATNLNFYDLVDAKVLQPAGMSSSGYFRSDALPPGAVLGHLANGRSNRDNVPRRGSGDGGGFTTLDDADRFWRALFEDRLVPEAMVTRLTRRTSEQYGLGFWISAQNDAPMLEGCDAGVSFRSMHDPKRNSGYTVMGNTMRGAWPLVRVLDAAGD